MLIKNLSIPVAAGFNLRFFKESQTEICSYQDFIKKPWTSEELQQIY